VGRAALQSALADDSGEVRVSIQGAPEVSGNVVRFRLEQRFPLPPELSATGAGRILELGTAIVSGGRISHLALVPDVTDAETMALLRLFASYGPDPALLPDAYIAEDGQTLVRQPAAVQIAFLAAHGDQAHVRWVEEHNAALERQAR
jgi:hypothetical protein